VVFLATADAGPLEGVGEVFRLDGLRANRAFLMEELLLKEDLPQLLFRSGRKLTRSHANRVRPDEAAKPRVVKRARSAFRS
jgi:hypothetical protein